MDTDSLVANQIDDGQRLITQLVRDEFEVSVAFWVKTSQEGLWHLQIASPLIDGQKPGEAFRKVYAGLSKIPDCSVLPLQITLINGADLTARAAADYRDRHPSRKPVKYRGKRLGNLDVEEAYIYPRRFPWEVRELSDGRWEVLISEFDDVWLACDSEEDARAIAAAPVLEYEALARVNSGPQFATELQKTADIMEKYRMSFGSRFFRRRAQEVDK